MRGAIATILVAVILSAGCLTGDAPAVGSGGGTLLGLQVANSGHEPATLRVFLDGELAFEGTLPASPSDPEVEEKTFEWHGTKVVVKAEAVENNVSVTEEVPLTPVTEAPEGPPYIVVEYEGKEIDIRRYDGRPVWD